MIYHKLLSYFFMFAIIVGSAACGVERGKELIETTADGLAVNGYDVIAYRTIDSAAKGTPQYEYVWKGAKWLFLNEENRARFAENPELYAPEYGGYCALSASKGEVVKSDPTQFKVINGKLYLLRDGQAKEVWLKNTDEYIKKGDENWKSLGKGDGKK